MSYPSWTGIPPATIPSGRSRHSFRHLPPERNSPTSPNLRTSPLYTAYHHPSTAIINSQGNIAGTMIGPQKLTDHKTIGIL
ncbi:hypothetical protein KDW_12430 [Dictyobacter vulcani]|uniref:Uncharacterized protein n=1 Tax=Dictyobacter vulcani TaxID=2607529 RepID=A0A5J4KLH4_9CHLR|nr:hypothetical protein [Dictyobacter vulcani]GER87081.1 hypothetical protein KDW_12430 [Dictyobacter vulcani]